MVSDQAPPVASPLASRSATLSGIPRATAARSPVGTAARSRHRPDGSVSATGAPSCSTASTIPGKRSLRLAFGPMPTGHVTSSVASSPTAATIRPSAVSVSS